MNVLLTTHLRRPRRIAARSLSLSERPHLEGDPLAACPVAAAFVPVVSGTAPPASPFLLLVQCLTDSCTADGMTCCKTMGEAFTRRTDDITTDDLSPPDELHRLGKLGTV